jgi:hypothetical protein
MSHLRLLYTAIAMCLNELCALIISGKKMFTNFNEELRKFVFSYILYVIIRDFDIYY